MYCSVPAGIRTGFTGFASRLSTIKAKQAGSGFLTKPY